MKARQKIIERILDLKDNQEDIKQHRQGDVDLLLNRKEIESQIKALTWALD